MAAELDPDDSSPWEQMGSCHYRLAGYDEAQQAFRKAVAIDSRSAKAHRGLGVVLMTRYLLNQQDVSLRDDALAAWHASLEIDPDQPDLRDFVKKYTPRYAGPEL
jgi:cytochrome c-type biogenesis protein CcmH/NrfG